MSAQKQNKTEKRKENEDQEVLCPQCGASGLETVQVEETFDHGGRKEPIHVTAVLPVKHCRKCDFAFEDWETEKARHRAACAAVGVQPPEEIRRLRQAVGLSQREFARLTRLGGATLNRWERGHLIQNGAYDDYLYLLRFPENVERLRQRKATGLPASPKNGREPLADSPPPARGCLRNGGVGRSNDVTINELWHCDDRATWDAALERYWQLVQPGNLELERALDRLDLARIRGLDAQGWYDFLYHEYFRWKYTAPNRLATTRRSLAKSRSGSALEQLDSIRTQLLQLQPHDIGAALRVAKAIPGLGTAGASGLLALMYPAHFGTVDQFVVKALCEVEGLPERAAVMKMKEKVEKKGALNLEDGVVLITILRTKADANNKAFGGTFWAPRKIDQILWTYGR
jgi:putative zinc finger/helix-turn-helix YgiT family protein